MNSTSYSAHRRNSASDRQPIIETWKEVKVFGKKIRAYKILYSIAGDFFAKTGGKRSGMERRPLLTIVVSQYLCRMLDEVLKIIQWSYIVFFSLRTKGKSVN